MDLSTKQMHRQLWLVLWLLCVKFFKVKIMEYQTPSSRYFDEAWYYFIIGFVQLKMKAIHGSKFQLTPKGL
jgi:hypothetical protein